MLSSYTIFDFNYFFSDFGYEQTNEEKCKPASWFDVDRPVFDCPENEHFNKSRG